MPQLNPTPWLFTMLASWLAFTLLIQPKLLSFTSPNTTLNKPLTTLKTPAPWNWPWT